MAPQTFTVHDFFAPLPAAEQQAIRAEFDALYGHYETPVYLVDSFAIDDQMVACNEAFTRLYGYQRHEVEGRNQGLKDHHNLKPDSPEALPSRALFLDHMRREHNRPATISRYHKAGHIVSKPFYIQLVHLGGRELLLHVMRLQEDGETFVSSLQGLSEFQNLMRAQRDGVVLFDCATPRLDIVDCNSSYAAMNGYTRAELIGQPAFNFSPHQASESPENYEDWLRTRKDKFIQDLREQGEIYYLGSHARKDGSIYTVSVLQYLVLIEGREHVLTTIRDMTEWGQLQNLEQARSDLLEHIAANAPLTTSLTNMVEIVEHQLPGAQCAIWVNSRWIDSREADGALCVHGTSFSPAFAEALRAQQNASFPEAQENIIRAAIAQRTMQFIDPMSTHRRWQADNLVRLVNRAQSCWALPVVSTKRSEARQTPEQKPEQKAIPEVLGVILIYLPEARRPQIGEINFLNSMLNLATIAVEQHRFVEKLAHQAEHDHLTGLPNRVLFQDRLQQTLVRSERQQAEFAVLFLDLDGFKHVNDTLGHAAGDTLLREVAERLRGAVRRSDTVARMGGDEFTVILPDVKVPGDVLNVAEKIAEAIKIPLEILDHEISVTSSIGIALYPRDGQDATTLQQKADAAMYEAKTSGKNRYFFYREALGQALEAKQDLKSQLRRAFEEKEFEVWYQPQMSTHNEQVLGFEALLRWKHPQLGLMLPASFIPAAEESGIILKIGEWVVRQACEQIKQWQIKTGIDLRVAVNVSALQVENAKFATAIERILRDTGLHPSCLEFDLAESIIVRNSSECPRTLERLHRLGVRLAVDDFATSYSSLRYLQKLPINVVKLDPSFTHAINQQRALCLLAESVILVAHEHQLHVLAEGVQTRAEFQTLQKLGCDSAQGYLFAHPMPAHEVEQFLEKANGILVQN